MSVGHVRYDTVSSLKLLLGALSITRKSCSKLTSERFTSALVNLFHNTPPANALLREARYHQPSGFLFPLMTMLYSPPPTTLLSLPILDLVTAFEDQIYLIIKSSIQVHVEHFFIFQTNIASIFLSYQYLMYNKYFMYIT